ncbi:hypothetical protein DFJ77DRAFT_478844 [Powellomyces hirtus]|nr:hypothetical protein DFJ77DRAFT_478844 [Powellomyces hirtus]
MVTMCRKANDDGGECDYVPLCVFFRVSPEHARENVVYVRGSRGLNGGCRDVVWDVDRGCRCIHHRPRGIRSGPLRRRRSSPRGIHHRPRSTFNRGLDGGGEVRNGTGDRVLHRGRERREVDPGDGVLHYRRQGREHAVDGVLHRGRNTSIRTTRRGTNPTTPRCDRTLHFPQNTITTTITCDRALHSPNNVPHHPAPFRTAHGRRTRPPCCRQHHNRNTREQCDRESHAVRACAESSVVPCSV